MTAADMGVVAAKAAMERAGVQPPQIEETIFGNARQAGGGPNPARQISVRSGIPREVPAYTVNKACASGMKSIALAYQEIATGNLDCVLAGGAESMSRLPYYLDGAAAVIVASAEFVKNNNLKPLAHIVAVTSAGVDPLVMGIGPVPALRKMEKRHNLKLTDFDLIELNEAFAAQVLACDRELHMDRDKLNVNGGAIALGHPIGCTGTRITVTLLHEMLRRKSKRGVATLCVSGGMGMALALENVT